MYRNSFQRGIFSIFYSIGSKPLALWDTCTKNGSITRFLDEDIKSSVLEICGTNVSTTYIICPKGKQVLGIAMPFLVMIVKNLKKYFSFEITILDDTGQKRRFRVSNFQSSTQICALFTVMPIALSEGWNQIQFNMADFTTRAYKKQFREVLKVKINANIRLRRIYFADRLIPEDELPPEYKLFFPLKYKDKKEENPLQESKRESIEQVEERKESIKEDVEKRKISVTEVIKQISASEKQLTTIPTVEVVTLVDEIIDDVIDKEQKIAAGSGLRQQSEKYSEVEQSKRVSQSTETSLVQHEVSKKSLSMADVDHLSKTSQTSKMIEPTNITSQTKSSGIIAPSKSGNEVEHKSSELSRTSENVGQQKSSKLSRVDVSDKAGQEKSSELLPEDKDQNAGHQKSSELLRSDISKSAVQKSTGSIGSKVSVNDAPKIAPSLKSTETSMDPNKQRSSKSIGPELSLNAEVKTSSAGRGSKTSFITEIGETVYIEGETEPNQTVMIDVVV